MRVSSIRTPTSIFSTARLDAGQYFALIDCYWTSPLREFNFSVYGPGKIGIRLMTPNQSVYASSEFEVWRSFALAEASKFKRQGTYILGEGACSATVSKFNYQDMKFGISLNRWDHERGTATLVKGFLASDLKGLEIVTDSGNGREHFINLLPRNSSVELFKMDPRVTEFNIAQKAIGIELVENPLPTPKSVRSHLSAYVAQIPVYSTPQTQQPQLPPQIPISQKPSIQNSGIREAPKLTEPPAAQIQVKRQAPPKSVKQARVPPVQDFPIPRPYETAPNSEEKNQIEQRYLGSTQFGSLPASRQPRSIRSANPDLEECKVI